MKGNLSVKAAYLHKQILPLQIVITVLTVVGKWEKGDV